MPNLSKLKRERMLAFLQKIKDEHRDDDDMLIALGEIESELTAKKYGLVWEQHEEAVDVMMRDHIPVFTEVPEREITAVPGQGYNFILEGDNLHALHLLTKTHRGKIDVIYIDPPYNTKNKDFIYDDKRIDSSDGFQHSKWISFMAERLRIAGDLLSKNGIMAISIGYHEVNNLMMLCQEMFSTKNVVCVTVQTSSGNAVQNGFTYVQEYIVFVGFKTAASSVPTIWTDTKFLTSAGSKDIKAVFGCKVDFPFPKPIALIKFYRYSCVRRA